MKNLIFKELRLAASPLTFVFLAFSLMTLIPRYPILVGALFVCLGIFYSFQSLRESNDMLYTLLLPVPKRDAVKAKYAFSCLIQALAFLLMAALTVLRMTALAGASAYEGNVMMAANPVYLAFALLCFATFNVLFLGGFFRTAYGIGWPFIRFIVAAMVLIGVGETLHHVPGLGFLDAVSGPEVLPQLGILAGGLAVYVLATLLSLRVSIARFEKLDF